MYQLYCSPNTYAMGVHAILEEIGADYEILPVRLFTEHPDPGFLQASPHGRVPALVHGAGGICESGAIALFLADRHPEAGLTVAPDLPDRADFLQCLFYLSSTLQPEVLIQFHPEAYFPDRARQIALKTASMGRLDKVWQVLDAALAPGPYFFGDRPRACDICLATQAIWPEAFSGAITDYPNVARMVASLTDRPAVARVLAWHEKERAKSGPEP